MKYDYTIIGAGPSGLITAYILGTLGKKCLILDMNHSIGGIHRVTRIDGLFSEHGPRVYSSSYVNTINVLKDMKIDFYKLFTPYHFKLSAVGGQSITKLEKTELLIFAKHFCFFIVNKEYGKDISMKVFLEENNFSENSIDYIDRLCRLTDGAGINRYSLFQFFQLLDQQVPYNLYQPKQPNDIGLFPQILKALKNTNNVHIKLDTKIIKIVSYNNEIRSVVTNNQMEYNVNNLILAIPPEAILHLLNKSNLVDIFNIDLPKWVHQSNYITDIPIIFHWDTHIGLEDIWGFPKSDWGVAFIILSNYMKFNNPKSKTVLSTCITLIDNKSEYLDKSPNQISDGKIIINEVYRQLLEAFPNLPYPTDVFIDPNVSYNHNLKKWTSNDTAFIKTYNNHYLPFYSDKIKNLFTVGTHNGKSPFHFTSFESATANAISFCHYIYPMTIDKFPLLYPYSLRKIIIVVIIILIILIIIYD